MDIQNFVAISLGSNLGNAKGNISQALQRLKDSNQFQLLIASNFYSSEAWGFNSENRFLNACCVLKTLLTPDETLRELQYIESALGRSKKSQLGYEDRIIDLDIIFYNNLVINSDFLQIPHPLMHVRNFVLEPLEEIAPTWIHPLYLRTVKELNNSSLDLSKVYAL